MNWLALLLVSLLGSSPRPPHSRAPVLLGTWKLKSVQLRIQQPNGTPPYTKEARVTFGATTQTFAKNGRWTQRLSGGLWKKGTYRVSNHLLTVYDGEDYYQEQIQELTSTQLVTVVGRTEVDGTHVQSIETFVR